MVGAVPRELVKMGVVLSRLGTFFEAFLAATQAGVVEQPGVVKRAGGSDISTQVLEELRLKGLYETSEQRRATATARVGGVVMVVEQRRSQRVVTAPTRLVTNSRGVQLDQRAGLDMAFGASFSRCPRGGDRIWALTVHVRA